MPLTVFAQQSVSGIPFSVVYKNAAVDAYETMPILAEAQKAIDADYRSSRLKRLKFAHPFDVTFNPENSGAWHTFANGDRVWRLGLVSKGAYSLSVVFGTYNLESGVKIYLYSPGYKHMLGAYSALNNNIAQKLAIQPLPGDTLIVEMDVPANVTSYGLLEISRIGHDFVDILKNLNYPGRGESETCNVDINCDNGLEWQREKYAVCHLFINSQDYCTGTLMNNTSKDKTPYVLTANHCIDTSTQAATTVFGFNIEKWKCGGKSGPKEITFSGSELIATTPYLDFSLVRMYDMPYFSARPYFAGWNRANIAPSLSVTIHHPNGDYKKITGDNDAAISASYPDDYNPNSHWMIYKWDYGSTQQGSSGAPLFNQYHQVVGSLTGGDANCFYPYRDYFAKLSSSWADYPEWKRQLRHWLDPFGTDSISIRGLDPFAEEKASCDTFKNVSAAEIKQLYSNDLLWGSYSGHNSQLITQFAEKIDAGGVLKIPGFYLNVAKAYSATTLSFISLKLWKGGDVPGNVITSRDIFLKDLTPGTLNYLTFDSTIFVSGPVYLGYAVNYSSAQDTFAVYQSQDRGIGGYSGMYVYKNGLWRNISEITTPAVYSSLAIGLVSCSLINSTSDIKPIRNQLKIYPNPVSAGLVTAEIPSGKDIVVSIYDLTGRAATAEWRLEGNQLMIHTSSLTSGTYILKVMIPDNGTYNAKFMVIK